jgi:hypothetical protein
MNESFFLSRARNGSNCSRCQFRLGRTIMEFPFGGKACSFRLKRNGKENKRLLLVTVHICG